MFSFLPLTSKSAASPGTDLAQLTKLEHSLYLGRTWIFTFKKTEELDIILQKKHLRRKQQLKLCIKYVLSCLLICRYDLLHGIQFINVPSNDKDPPLGRYYFLPKGNVNRKGQKELRLIPSHLSLHLSDRTPIPSVGHTVESGDEAPYRNRTEMTGASATGVLKDGSEQKNTARIMAAVITCMAYQKRRTLHFVNIDNKGRK